MAKSSVTVTKNGNVFNGDTLAGRVDRTTDGTSRISIISGNPGPVRWIAVSLDGKKVSGLCTTRTEAANIVARYAAPVCVKDMRREHALSGGVMVWSASLHFKGHCIGVDQREGETQWFSHFEWIRGAPCPRLSQGVGTRPARPIIDDECITALNAARDGAIEADQS